MLKQLQIHRQIFYDLTALHLQSMKGLYERLAYLAGLRDPATGNYAHETLGARYPVDRVNEALEHCHEEVFERLLESPLFALEQDLVSYLETPEGVRALQLRSCRELTHSWMPPQAPEYLQALYCSNQDALCELLQVGRAKARAGS